MSNGYADITEVQGRQIALVHKIIDEGIQPAYTKDGWECFNLNNEPVIKKGEPIRKIEQPKYRRRYKK